MLKIEARNVGKLIGPKGATIREIQDQYNVKISISKENDPVSKSLVECVCLFCKQFSSFLNFFVCLGWNAKC